MKDVKAYNVIFPLWFLLFFPPVILITLIGNFIIDSLVLIGCYYAFKVSNTLTLKGFYKNPMKGFYKDTILKVWGFGFLADIIGAAILFATGMFGDFFGIPYEIISAVSYNPFDHPVATLIVIISMLVAGLLIFIFNYSIVFKKRIEDQKTRLKVALTIAIITIPWTFMIPTQWLYKGF